MKLGSMHLYTQQLQIWVTILTNNSKHGSILYFQQKLTMTRFTTAALYIQQQITKNRLINFEIKVQRLCIQNEGDSLRFSGWRLKQRN